MEMFNFSSGETARFKRALSFVHRQELDTELLAANTLIVKTENFEDECEQLAPYFSGLGLENANARLVFHPNQGGHKILVNKAAISELSYIHTMVTELVHLANLIPYNAEYGNVYRFTQEQAIGHYYYEFLLWTKFQAMKIATRAHALASWHEQNGEAPPEGGCYQFGKVSLHSDRVVAALGGLQAAGTIAAWREGLWDVLEELAFYFGRLAFYQQNPRPEELDEHFPAAAIAAMVGLEPCQALYAALQQARTYGQWRQQQSPIRKAIVAMQEHGRGLFAPGV